MPPLEAMQCETPVVTSKIASIPEVCGDAVEYFNPHKVEDMTAVIATVLCSGSTQEHLVKRGLKQVKKFNWDICAPQTFKQYEEILKLKTRI